MKETKFNCSEYANGSKSFAYFIYSAVDDDASIDFSLFLLALANSQGLDKPPLSKDVRFKVVVSMYMFSLILFKRI